MAADEDTPPLELGEGGALDDPLEAWPNGDLLLEQVDRDFFERNHPSLAPIFDWPELRACFEPYNAKAAAARRRSRRFGIRAVVAGFVGLVLGAVSSVVVAVAPSMVGPAAGLGLFAALLAVISLIMGWTQILRGRQKAIWLVDRFYAERIRQFHFQLILNNLHLVTRALTSTHELEAWKRFREDQLRIFRHNHLQSAGETLHHLLRDHAERDAWTVDEWSEPGPTPHPSPQLDGLLAVLGKQRFGIQRRYATLKLTEGAYSPSTRARWVLRLSDSLTLLLLLATIVAGACAASAFLGRQANLARACAIAAGAMCSAAVIALRVLNEGLQFSADAERFTWYLAAVEALDAQFRRADAARKIELLRDMECMAYQEMRRFIVSSEQSRFIM